ncbi:peptide-methionine (S)-S-oxide reductase MsrA [Stieleria sp. ICT_E10.1]|uniref:peptide-methionine (S)-S-oxide reductase MsrA n=1 Tax=Stieleria sedimenti TaxID=2976331 RepID=UPI0021807AD8|nr:peptide-methionine (S)-S-oxide reductase MsrA [Stieleria sedimenti]MCS7467640.1 peptide-methionine (S)-S-oxide reductase MsrA [Stieleria sedimenti]
MMSNTRVAVRVAEQPQRQTQKTAWICFWVLAALASFCLNVSAAPRPDEASAASADKVDTKDQPQKEELVATFAGGCFWCTEAVFERMIGVNDVISGYIGGTVPNPTYEQVCGKKTGHAEAVEIYYDPSQVTFEELLEVFFKTHDPTTLNRQGADEGPQYRSSVFFHDEQQKDATQAYIKKLNESGEFDREIVTLLEKATTFYPAEEVHQDFYRKNPNYGYCQAVVRDKVRKFNRNFGDKIKK